MRPIDRVAPALELIVDKPWARKGYDDLLACYESAGMAAEADVVRFLVSEKFVADHTNPYKGQLEDDTGMS